MKKFLIPFTRFPFSVVSIIKLMERAKLHFDLARLVARFLNGELTHEEYEKLKAWIEVNDKHRELWSRLTNQEYLESNLEFWRRKDDNQWQNLLKKIRNSESEKRWFGLKNVWPYAAILTALLLIGVVTKYFINGNNSSEANTLALAAKKNAGILPEGGVAQLILGDGRVVNLKGSHGQTIIEKDGTKVQNEKSVLKYFVIPDKQRSAVFNTLKVPRGGEYKVTLADGTNVWLNAATSLKYPTQFDGKERIVFLSGEAYFEVKHDAAHPFKVMIGNTVVRVLGTKFNVSAYNDDSKERVSLIEGSVEVSRRKEGHKEEVVLKPGYSAIIGENEIAVNNDNENVKTTVAWKDSMFVFKNETLESIMKRLSRWYDVGIVYDDNVDKYIHFTGKVQKYESIDDVLHLIEMTNKVTFDITGREIRVKLNKTVPNEKWVTNGEEE